MSATSQPCCLIAEDHAVIGVALEATFQEFGVAVAGPFPCCKSALDWTRNSKPDVALLDFHLQDGPCMELARILLRRGIPVVIYSGSPRVPDLPEELRTVVWIEKPADQAKLVDVVLSFIPIGSSH